MLPTQLALVPHLLLGHFSNELRELGVGTMRAHRAHTPGYVFADSLFASGMNCRKPRLGVGALL
jgi:hypothetical protein